MTKRNILLWLFTLVIGLIFSLHNLLPYLAAQKDPQLFYTPFNGGDENLYATQIREVFEGKLFSGDPFIYETKHLPPFLPWLGSLIFGLFSQLFHSLELTFILADFFFPAIIFLLIFKFVFKITKHYWGSILAGLSTLFLFPLITKFPPITPNLLQGFWQTLILKPAYFFSFQRLIPPQFTFIIFLLFLFSLYQAIITKAKAWPFLVGLFSGSLAYLYFYHWSASLLILGITLLISFIYRSPYRSRLLVALIIALLFSSGYLHNLFALNLLDKQISFGRINGRFIEPLTTLRYGLVAILIYKFLKPQSIRRILLAIFFSALLLMNLQFFLSFTLAPGHWPHSTFEPLLVITIFIILSLSFKKYFPDNFKIALLTIPILFYATLNQVKITQQWQSLNFLSSSEVQLFGWLNYNSLKDNVVLTLDKRLNRYLPVLTGSNLYLPYGSYSQLTTKQLWQRTNLAFSLYNLTKEGITDYLNNTQFIGQLFDQTYNYHQKSDLYGLDFPQTIKSKISQAHPIFTFGVRYIPDNLKQQSFNQVANLLSTPLKTRLCQFKLDYLLIPQPSNLPSLTSLYFNLVFQTNDLQLYQVKSDVCHQNS